MEIIDNFGLPSKLKEGFNPWVENILDMIQAAAPGKKSTLRLTGNRTNNTIIYTLRNSQNKTSADFYKRNKMFHLDLYKRDTPDPEKAIKPDNVMLSSYVFKKGSIDELEEMAQLVSDLVTMETPYSQGTVKKTKVVPTSDAVDKTMLRGGQITGILYNADDTELIVEKGKARYHMNKDVLGECRLSLLKYIIFNDKNEFALINSPEFDFYYEMA